MDSTEIAAPINDLFNFAFELTNHPESGLPQTSRISIGFDRSRMESILRRVRELLVLRYGFRQGDLVDMSSHEPEGLFVWVRSRVPIPPKVLGTQSDRTAIGKPFVDVDAHESDNKRLEVRPKLLPDRGSDTVIDV